MFLVGFSGLKLIGDASPLPDLRSSWPSHCLSVCQRPDLGYMGTEEPSGLRTSTRVARLPTPS